MLNRSEETITWDDLYDFMDEVKAMARGLLRCEGNAQSLQTTALVNTALRRQKLSTQQWNEVQWESRKHFFDAMYIAMKRALIDHGRKRAAKKRSAIECISTEALKSKNIEDIIQNEFVQPYELKTTLEKEPDKIVMLIEALDLLRRRHPDLSRVVEHRYYGGLTINQTARVMGISEGTVKRRWTKAKLLLYDEIIAKLQGTEK